jgi:hypothetical protein
LDAPSFDDIADSLGTAEDASLFDLFQEGVSGGEGIIRKVQFEGPHESISSRKYDKNIKIPRRTMCLPSYRHKAFLTQIFRKLLLIANAKSRYYTPLSELSFMQRLTLLLFLPSEDSPSTSVPSGAWSENH